MVRRRSELEAIAKEALCSLPGDLQPCELAYVLSEMLKMHSLMLLKLHGEED